MKHPPAVVYQVPTAPHHAPLALPPSGAPWPLGVPRAPGAFRAGLGDELGRKAAVGLVALGSGALVVGAIALVGWLGWKRFCAWREERRQKAAAKEAGKRIEVKAIEDKHTPTVADTIGCVDTGAPRVSTIERVTMPRKAPRTRRSKAAAIA